jgi:hypothetical protein
VTERELALRRTIMESFAETGAPPHVVDRVTLSALAVQHVVVLTDDHRATPRILMAHPFAAHHAGARVESGGRTWWGNCAWDALGIVAALDLADAQVTDASGLTLEVRGGRPVGDAVFHIVVPAREWWADIGFT